MNVEADALATYILNEFYAPQPVVPFDPDSKVMLTIAGSTITRDIETHILHSRHSHNILEYYRKRFHWSIDDTDAIDWDNYASVYKKFPRSRTFFSKFGWKKLPTGERLHKRSNCYDHRCQGCHEDLESDDHIFRCAKHEEWRRTLLKNISTTFSPYVDANLLLIIRIGLDSYFEDDVPRFNEHFPKRLSETPYRDVIRQQTSIGWDQFIRGKVSKEWDKMQQYYAKSNGYEEESKGWMTRLIRLLATESFKLWEIRNGNRHGTDDATKALATEAQTQRELRMLYLLKEKTLPQDHIFFRTTITEHMKEPTPVIRNWITRHKKLILKSVRTAGKQMQLKTRGLQKYFIRMNPIRSTTKKATRQTETTKRRKTTILGDFFAPKQNNQKQPKERTTTTEPARKNFRQLYMGNKFPDHPG